MRIRTTAAAAVLAAGMSFPLAGGALAQDSPLSMDVDTSECGEATFTFTNPTDFLFAMEYWQEGQEPVEEDHPIVTEGEFASTYPTLTIDNREDTDDSEPDNQEVTLEFEEDEGDGEVTVYQRVKLGAEQDFYLDRESATVDTDCETEEPTETTEPTVPEEPTETTEPTIPDEPPEVDDNKGDKAGDKVDQVEQDNDQVERVPEGGVETGGGPGGGPGGDAPGYILGGVALTAAVGGTVAATRRRRHQNG